jgi:predicted esterase
MRIRLVTALVVVLSVFPQTVSTASAQVTSSDMSMLGLIFRNRFVPFSEAEGLPGLAAIVERVAEIGPDGDDIERYQTMIEGMARMYLGRWDEGVEVASILDVELPAKLYEPGAAVPVRMAPVYERTDPLIDGYLVNVRLLGPDGTVLNEADEISFDTLETMRAVVVIPRDAPSGRYLVEYTLSSVGAEQPIMATSRSIFVVEALEERLTEMLFDSRQRAVRRQIGRSRSRALANTTVLWHLESYQRARSEWVGGPYQGYPAVMNYIFEQGALMVEAMRFDEEIELVEGLILDLGRGRDPLAARTGDMRLAYRSGVDRELVPFRVFIPDDYDRNASYPLVVALHGSGGDENTYMDGFDGTLKENAASRGYIIAAVNGRGPYEAYRTAGARDVVDVLDLVQRVYPIDEGRTYLTGHSSGGSGTVRIGFENADRFAAIAPVAGFGSSDDLSKALDLPVFLAIGGLDALVSPEGARAFYETAQELGMPDFQFVLNPAADHVGIVADVMEQVFDWFDAHRR